MTNKLIEAMAWAIAERLEAFDIHGIPQAALKAISDAGYAVVPREPTEAMIEAGHRIHDFDDSMSDLADDYNRRNAAAIYRAMINATTTEEI